MIKCPKCATINPNNHIHCKRCGEKLPEIVKRGAPSNDESNNDNPLHKTHENSLHGKWRWY